MLSILILHYDVAAYSVSEFGSDTRSSNREDPPPKRLTIKNQLFTQSFENSTPPN